VGCHCFPFFLLAMVFLRVWMSVRKVFASGVGCLCFFLGGCVGESVRVVYISFISEVGTLLSTSFTCATKHI